MARWRRITGVTSIAAGAVAAAMGAAVAAEKIAVGRIRLRPDPAAAEPLGQLRGRELTVAADDGVPLHAEIDGPQNAPVTVIFSHGYTLNQDCWHYQRRDLGAADHAGRLVFWDQRSHGRSGRSDPGHENIDQLGRDLRAVIEAVAPRGAPVVLVGHSMGATTIMALAGQHPELFGSQVTGVALICTSAGRPAEVTLGLPGPLGTVLRHAAPSVLRGAARGRRADFVERARQAGGDLAFLFTRFIAFGDPSTSPTITDFVEQMIRATPVDVVARFFAALTEHEEIAALPTLGKVPTLIIAGGRDRLTPKSLSEEMAAEIPGAELVVDEGAGHLIMLEHPELVTTELARLVERAGACVGRRGERSA
ncbi:MAG TPA: alpha/beta hydrolase [Streptosporangiaceae bacterium]|nr:alpha/beta hydrolase [Streptosporangiaceae bacterium]